MKKIDAELKASRTGLWLSFELGNRSEVINLTNENSEQLRSLILRAWSNIKEDEQGIKNEMHMERE